MGQRRDNSGASHDIDSILEEMRRQYREGLEEPEEEAPAETSEYLLFTLGGRRFAMPTSLAREVIRPPHLVRVPGTAPTIAGIINLRGQVTVVTDLCPLLGLERQGDIGDGRLIAVQSDGASAALAVEKVSGIRKLPDEDIEPPGPGGGGFSREVMIGQISMESELLIILDIKRLLESGDLSINQKKA